MSVKINKTLFSVTNRDNFVTPMFDGGPELLQVIPSKEEANTRQLLGLDILDTDYYVIGILQAIEAYPEIDEQFKDLNKTYDLARLDVPINKGVGCNLIPDKDGPPYVRTKTLEFPVSFDIQLKYLSDKNMKIVVGKKYYQVSYSKRDDFTIFPDWPEELDIRGGVELNTKWAQGNPAKIQYWPLNFPYDKIARALEEDNQHGIFMLDTVFSEAYHSTQFDMEKVALSAAALGIKNKSVYK
jgi:hypothetical protein